MTPFPKYRRKETILPSTEMANSFLKKYPNYSNVKPSDFRKIIGEFNKRVMQEVVDNRNGVMLPDLLGCIFIGSSKTDKQVKSYSKYSDNEAVRYTNVATDGRILKFLFSASVTSVPFKNFTCWSFKANRDVRRNTAKLFENNYQKYVDITNIKIGELFYTKKTDNTPEEKTEVLEESYNEFDL